MLIGLTSESEETRYLMRCVFPKIQSSKYVFESYSISQCLYCFRSMSTKYAETRALLSLFIYKLIACKKPFTTDQIVLIFQGMKCMSSSVPEVKQLINAVMDQLKLNIQNIYYFNPMQVNKL